MPVRNGRLPVLTLDAAGTLLRFRQPFMSVQSTSIAASPAPGVAAPRSLWQNTVIMARQLAPTAAYLMTTEVHTFAFSVAANAILSFFPFVVLLLTITTKVLHSKPMTDVILDLLRDYLPVGQDFVIRNLKALVNARKGAQIVSFVMLLITSTGVFL